MFKTYSKIVYSDKKTHLPLVKKPVAIWNNQNFKVNPDSLEFPVWKKKKSKRITVKAEIPESAFVDLTTYKLGSLRITSKRGNLIAQIAVTIPDITTINTGVMGVDLGLKCPAVCYTDTGKVHFSGSGRHNKYIKRHFKSKRRELGKAKKPNVIKRIGSKEQRIMDDIDHKTSRDVVNFAIKNKVGVIRIETLAGIRESVAEARETTRKSRKNVSYIHNWSFYRLANYIDYKARLAGIRVEYVDPAYTSQRCPECGALNHAEDRNYVCECGYHTHRDLVGAINICLSAPEKSAKRASA